MPCIQIKYITMKKLMISLLALYLASSVNAQNLHQEQIKISVFDVREMIHTIDDILEWNSNDAAEGYTGNGSYEEGWGSNYWLRVMRDKLYDELHTQRVNRVEVDCENCDEID